MRLENIRGMKRPAWILCLALAGSGCSAPALVKSVVTANVVQEEAHNQLLAMNIARAWHRMPMHFTQVTAVRSAPNGLPLTPGLGAEFGLGGAATPLVTFTPSLSSSLQNVDVAVMSGQEFMQGMTNPVAPSLMLYFLDQGWPKAMVLHLFIHAIEIYREDGDNEVLESRYKNSPDIDAPGADHDENYHQFRELVWSMSQCELTNDIEDNSIPYSAAVPYGKLENLEGIAAVKAAGLVPRPFALPASASQEGKNLAPLERANATHVRFMQLKEDRRLKITQAPGRRDDNGCDHLGTPGDQRVTVSAYIAVTGRDVTQNRVLEKQSRAAATRPDSASAPGTGSAPANQKDRIMRLVMRSPEAMIYYLGEISRAGSRVAQCQLSAFSGGKQTESVCKKLFEMKHLPPAERAASADQALAIEYQDERYAVRKWDWQDRSVQTLSMLSQVLALQNKGLTPPTTATVRVLQ